MSYTNYSINDKLNLIVYNQDQEEQEAVPTEVPVSHVLILDVSGSMSYTLPQMREQIKLKLPSLVGEKDTVSIIWFSGRGEYGVVLEGEPIATLKDLNNVYKLIDRWLVPVGLTGFKEPIEEATRLVDRIQKKNPGSTFSFFFLSDGHDNCSSKKDILTAVEKAADKFSAATVVEYGYYADRQLLSQMADKLGGSLIFSEGFEKYAPVFEASLSKKLTGAPRVTVQVPGDPVGGFVFSLEKTEIVTYSIEGNTVKVPKDLKSFAYISSSPGQFSSATPVEEGTNLSKAIRGHGKISNYTYAAISLFTGRMNSNVVLPLLKATGDIKYIELFAGAFGKQKISDLQEATKEAVFDHKLRLQKGLDYNKIPPDDAFTVLQLLEILAQDEDNRLLLNNKNFQYSRIGRGRVDASTVLTKEEQTQFEDLVDQMAKEKDPKKISELSLKIGALTANKGKALKLAVSNADEGYPVRDLVFTKNRPNVSIRILKEGTIDISERCPEEYKSVLPQQFPSHEWRNYTIIKDGLVNVEVLPCKVSKETIKLLKKKGMPEAAMEELADGVILFKLRELPVINRQMITAVTAKELFQLEWNILEASAAQKVFKDYKEAILGKKVSASYRNNYGEAATLWLSEQGITDFNGFNPKSVTAESVDFYLSKELDVKIKGFSSLPPLDKVREKAIKGKSLTPSEALVKKYIDYVDAFLKTDVQNISETQKRMLEGWLETETKASIESCRKLLYKKAQLVFTIIVGQVWFTDLDNPNDTSMELVLGGEKRNCSIEMNEKEVKI